MLEAIEKGWDASKPFNPYYGYGAAVIAILKALQIFKKKNETETALREVVVGVENIKKNGGDVKKAMGESESLATKNMVSVIRNNIA